MVLGMVRVVKRVELPVAKIKNTGANIKHVFTSRFGRKEKDNKLPLHEVSCVVDVCAKD